MLDELGSGVLLEATLELTELLASGGEPESVLLEPPQALKVTRLSKITRCLCMAVVSVEQSGYLKPWILQRKRQCAIV